MSHADIEKIKQQIHRCPSSALSYIINKKQLKTGPLPEVKKDVKRTTIRCLKNGPYLVREIITIKKPDGTEETREGSTALCRCGIPAIKPFCDGSHSKIGFEGE